LEWQVDLLKTSPFWMGWFEGLTNQFLQIRIPKILMLAEKERLDKDLTVAQMQGKFRLVVLQNTGHSIQEDDPKNTAYNFHDFLIKFRIPTTVEELKHLK
jgi:protein phosphatase methylesterase 1